MASFWDKLTAYYRQGTVVIQLIFINAGVFLLIRLLVGILGLFGVAAKGWLDWIQMPAEVAVFLTRPWTALTYMFVHYNLMHILMNMLWLYFFGKMFLRWHSERQLVFHYITGGLSGALLFVIGNFWLFTSTDVSGQAPLIGASASVMALCIAVSVLRPDEPIALFLLGSLKMKYIALIVIVLDLIGFNSSNAGVGLAHLGGALYGLAVGLTMRRGFDMSAWINPFLNLFLARPVKHAAKRPSMRVKYQRSKKETTNRTVDPDQAFRDQKKRETDQLDTILDKVKQSGYDSLSKEEKKQLFDFSNRSNSK